MPFSFSREQMQGIQPVLPGLYVVQFETFKPKWAKLKEGQSVPSSVNFNAYVNIVHPDYEFGKQKVVANLNDQIPGFIRDFHHSFGVEMVDEDLQQLKFPGSLEANPAIYNPQDPATWVYAGPLVGKQAEWELGVREYNGVLRQEIRRFICKVPMCAERWPDLKHSMDMAKKS